MKKKIVYFFSYEKSYKAIEKLEFSNKAKGYNINQQVYLSSVAADIFVRNNAK